MRSGIPLYRAKYVAISRNFARSPRIGHKSRPTPQNRPEGESAGGRHFQAPPTIIRNRPMIDEVRNPPYPQVGGDSAEFRSTPPHELAINRDHSPQYRPAGESTNARYFEDCSNIIRNRPMINEVRISALSPHVGGDFAEFRQIVLN